MTANQINEAMSRAVIGGLVKRWSQTSVVWNVTTNDGAQHLFTPHEASAFADAVYAAERADAIRIRTGKQP